MTSRHIRVVGVLEGYKSHNNSGRCKLSSSLRLQSFIPRKGLFQLEYYISNVHLKERQILTSLNVPPI